MERIRAERSDLGREMSPDRGGERVAAHRAAPELIERNEIRGRELLIRRLRIQRREPADIAADEIHFELRDAVGHRLVQRNTHPGLGRLHGAVEHDLFRQPLHVLRQRHRGCGRNRPRFAEQPEHRVADVSRQGIRLARQDQRIRRHRDAQFADRTLQREPALHVGVAVQRRRGHLAGDPCDQIEADGCRIPRGNTFHLSRCVADHGGTGNVLREQIEADEVRGRLGCVGHRDVERIFFAGCHRVRVRERERERRIPHQHGARGAARHLHRPDR